MLRRTLLQIAVALFAARPVRALARLLQAPPFSTSEIETLSAVAEVVLPSDLTVQDRKRVVDRFVAWFVNYRQGADMGHGYGASTLRQRSGPSPVSRYPAQFAELESAARERGGATFRSLPAAARREIVEKLLNEPQAVNRLPAQPTGANLIADFMGSYFTSADAWDRCYRAEIRRDSCRTLDDSAQQPRRVGRGLSPGSIAGPEGPAYIGTFAGRGFSPGSIAGPEGPAYTRTSAGRGFSSGSIAGPEGPAYTRTFGGRGFSPGEEP